MSFIYNGRKQDGAMDSLPSVQAANSGSFTRGVSIDYSITDSWNGGK